jgi:predicted dehydrogenase
MADVEIAAICELDEDRLNSTADRYGVTDRRICRRLDDYQQAVLDLKPDAVYAIGQPNVMYPVWKWCLEQRCNLYVEKPLGLSAHQARSLAHLARHNGCITQVSFQRRITPMIVQLREECLKRGPIQHAVCEFYKCAPAPCLDARDHMMDDGVHAIDTLRWMCGGEVVEIEAVTRRIGVPDINFFAALLRFDNGATGIMLNSWTSGRRIFRVQMHAGGICAEGEHEGKGAIYADGDTNGVWYDTRQAAGSDANFVFGGFLAKHREFIDCVKSGAQPGSCFADAAKTMEVADRILAMDIVNCP